MKPEEQNAFAQFFEGDETTSDDTPDKRFAMLKTVFAEDPELETLEEVRWTSPFRTITGTG